jgi:hypothetical protein
MRTKTILYCDGLDADGNPCPSHFERETSVHGGGMVGVARGLPPGWWNASFTKEIAPRERRSASNLMDSPALQIMIEAIGKSVTPPDKDRAAQLEQILERIKRTAGDARDQQIVHAISTDVALATMLVGQVVSTPEKIEVQMKQMIDEMRKAYDAVDADAPAPHPRRIGIRATLCNLHPQPDVQFDESKIPEWMGVSVCDHDDIEIGEYAPIGMGEASMAQPLGGAHVATPVGYGG